MSKQYERTNTVSEKMPELQLLILLVDIFPHVNYISLLIFFKMESGKHDKLLFPNKSSEKTMNTIYLRNENDNHSFHPPEILI